MLVAACGGDEVIVDTDSGVTPDGGMLDGSNTDLGTDASTAPGSLVEVGASSTVGVLLDEFPAGIRDRVAAELIAMPSAFWIERAKQQLHLTDLRLIYRSGYYTEEENKNALPLPPESQWTIALAEAGPTRMTVDDHDLVAVSYEFSATLLSDEASPGISEPALGTVGGTWDEEFVFPIDPTLLLQRTGYACMDEDQFPPESVDAENAYQYYDDYCEVESPAEPGCHHTFFPEESCVDAVTRVIGHIGATVHFERVAWNAATADAVRSGEVTNAESADMKVVTTGRQSLSNNRIIYKYIPADHCSVVESCVGGSGWRRLVEFDSMDHNVGGLPLEIGPVDYFVEGLGSELIMNNVYTYSACHNHYHFQYYGDFYFGDSADGAIHKNGFCLETTSRLSNHEGSPLHTDYDCSNQGVEAGWGDLYAAGLTCNWIDVTGVDTSDGAVTDDLTFHSNPDGFLCEGSLTLDMSGNQVWEDTTFTTSEGDPVRRPACDEAANTEENDLASVPLTVPQVGGMMSSACTSDQTMGPNRNCGFTMTPGAVACTPGEVVHLECTSSDSTPQVVRFCETSHVLATGVDCSHQDALANVVTSAAATDVFFECPAMRDVNEPGGQYAMYVAPAFNSDAISAVDCHAPTL